MASAFAPGDLSVGRRRRGGAFGLVEACAPVFAASPAVGQSMTEAERQALRKLGTMIKRKYVGAPSQSLDGSRTIRAERTTRIGR